MEDGVLMIIRIYTKVPLEVISDKIANLILGVLIS